MSGREGPVGSTEHGVSEPQVSVRRAAGPAHGIDAERQLRSEGLSPTAWGNAPGYRYDSHTHPYHKVLYCVSGSITFHTDKRDVALGPGDRLELGSGVPHAATVGEGGVECVEAAREE